MGLASPANAVVWPQHKGQGVQGGVAIILGIKLVDGIVGNHLRLLRRDLDAQVSLDHILDLLGAWIFPSSPARSSSEIAAF